MTHYILSSHHHIINYYLSEICDILTNRTLWSNRRHLCAPQMLILYHFCVFRLVGGAPLPTEPRAPGRQSWGLQTHLSLQHPDGKAAPGGAEGVFLPDLIPGRKSALFPRRQQSLKSGKVRMYSCVGTHILTNTLTNT